MGNQRFDALVERFKKDLGIPHDEAVKMAEKQQWARLSGGVDDMERFSGPACDRIMTGLTRVWHWLRARLVRTFRRGSGGVRD